MTCWITLPSGICMIQIALLGKICSVCQIILPIRIRMYDINHVAWWDLSVRCRRHCLVGSAQRMIYRIQIMLPRGICMTICVVQIIRVAWWYLYDLGHAACCDLYDDLHDLDCVLPAGICMMAWWDWDLLMICIIQIMHIIAGWGSEQQQQFLESYLCVPFGGEGGRGRGRWRCSSTASVTIGASR